MADIIEHNKPNDLADLPDHPIPALNGLDIMTVKKDGGADLTVVISDPINGSEFSQNRLLIKLQNYFGFINSEEYIYQAKVRPTPDNTIVIVKIHPDSSGAYSDLISRCLSWANENNCSIELRILTESELGSSS